MPGFRGCADLAASASTSSDFCSGAGEAAMLWFRELFCCALRSDSSTSLEGGSAWAWLYLYASPLFLRMDLGAGALGFGTWRGCGGGSAGSCDGDLDGALSAPLAFEVSFLKKSIAL